MVPFRSVSRLTGFALVVTISACGEDSGNGSPGAGGGLSPGGGAGSGGVSSGGASSGSSSFGGASTGGASTGGAATDGGTRANSGGFASGGVGASTGGTPPGSGGRAQGGASSAAGGAKTSGGTGGSGTNSGGRASGGAPGNGGTSGGTAAYPCDGTTTGYDATVVLNGTTWTVTRNGATVTTSTDMATAMYAGINSLSANRSAKQSVLVQGSGSISANSQTNLPNFLVLNVCGTIDVSGSPSGSDKAPIYARGRHDIEIPNLKMTGAPMYGMFFRNVDNLSLGNIELELSGGLGIRIDNNAQAQKNTNVVIERVSGKGTASHVVETYGIDKIRIGTITGKDVGECGLLLNNTTNAEVELVSCDNCGAGTGYAAFRIANDAGKIGNDWPAGNIHVKKVYARAGGRGVFSVSGSGGLTIDQLDLADTGNNAILLQNCINTTIATQSGTVSNGSIILSNDTTNTNNGMFEPSRNVTLQNLTLSNGANMSEGWCDLGDRKNRAKNISGATPKMCFED